MGEGEGLVWVQELSPNAKRVGGTNAGEWAGSCPVCGGTDRFRIWPYHEKGPRCWCRRCGISGAVDYIRRKLANPRLMDKDVGKKWVYVRMEPPGIAVPTMRAIRHNKADGTKSFHIQRWTGSCWENGTPPPPWPLYAADALARARREDRPVLLLEGEKCAEIASAFGLIATTNPCGAAAVAKADWAMLAGLTVCVWPDNDEPGMKWRESVRRHLHAVGAVLLDFDIRGITLPAGGDIEQFVAQIGDRADAELRERFTKPARKIQVEAAMRGAREINLHGTTPAGDALRSVFATGVLPPETELHQAPLFRFSGFATPPPQETCKPEKLKPGLSAASIAPEVIQWLWPGLLAVGKTTLLAGNPGEGKSFITMDLAARVSRGGPVPLTEPPFEMPAGDVYVLNAEDGVGDTLVPRLIALGANLDRVRFLDDLADLDGIDEAALLVVDPVSCYLGPIDGNNNAQVREFLAQFHRFGERTGAATLIVSHLNKREGGDVKMRIAGSLAFIAAVRIAVTVERGRLDVAKSNLPDPVRDLAFEIAEGRIEWKRHVEPVLQSREDVRDAIADWLLAWLAGGPQLANATLDAGVAKGFTVGAMRRAAKRIGVSFSRTQTGAYVWELGQPESEGVSDGPAVDGH